MGFEFINFLNLITWENRKNLYKYVAFYSIETSNIETAIKEYSTNIVHY
jgi:hypothetical protein